MQITVRVPATTANLGPGFDSIGMALGLAGEVRFEDRAAIVPPVTGPGPRLALAAARALYERAGSIVPPGLFAEILHNVPAGRGLGASALVRAAGLVAANALLGGQLSREELLAIGAELEGHPDNITPALFGGLQVMVRSDGAVTHVKLPVAPGLSAVIVVPEFEMPTDESRRLLPSHLSRDDAVFNIGRSALLVAALASGRFDALRVATQDRLHQPVRGKLFPALAPAVAAALEAGALGAFLSGGGSSILAFAAGDEDRIGQSMLAAVRAQGFEASYLVTEPSESGAEIIEQG